MIDFVSDQDINKEVKTIEESPRLSAFSGRQYPIEYLSSREFELLTFFTFKKDIVNGIFKGQIDVCRLMNGTADKGRDILLQYAGKNVGVVQCKRFENLITRPGLAREIIKFILHALQDDELISDADTFTYYFTALKGFNSPATKLLTGFNTEVTEDEDLASWTNEVIKENETIKFKKYEDVEERLLNILKKIKVEPLTAVELDQKLKNSKEIISIFFEVEKVASEDMLRKVLNEYTGFKNDEDLEKLRLKLKDVPTEKRMYFGLFDIYGYDLDFYKKIIRDKEFVFEIAKIKSEFSKRFIDHLGEFIDKYILLFISGIPEVSPFTKSIMKPYLFNKFALQHNKAELGAFATQIFEKDRQESLIEKYQTIEEHLSYALEIGQIVLNNDYSTFVGDEQLLQLKKDLCQFTYGSFKNIDEMKTRFYEDMKIIQPILEIIESEIQVIMPENPTIIIGSGNLGNTEEEVVDLFKKVQKLN